MHFIFLLRRILLLYFYTIKLKRIYMSSLLSKIKSSRLYIAVTNFFKHDCSNHEKLVSGHYYKDGDTNSYCVLSREYKCKKCGKKWVE